MRGRSRDRIKFWLERFLLKGAHYRLLFIAAVIGLLSIVSGGLVLAAGSFDSFPEAVWWAFLRLSDPGYLGDDEGALVRTVSTVLTVAGYVVFLGSLVAIMTQWLNSTIQRLESGLTPVTRSDHVVILGWTNRTVPIVEELLLSEVRVKRFLRLHGARRLHIVILCEEVTPALRQDLREQLGELWSESQITLRSGSSLRTEHLERADFLNAAVILVPGGEAGREGAGDVDTRTIKTLLSISRAAEAEGDEPPPYAVAEIFDARKAAVARRSYGGPLELIPTNVAIARLMAQNLRHPGLSLVYNELLAQGDGNEIYLPDGDAFEGLPVEALAGAFPRGVVLGVVRGEGTRLRPHLNPGPGFRVEVGDRIVVMARAYQDTQEGARGEPRELPRGEPGTLVPHVGSRRVLVLGWSQKLPALLREIRTYRDESIEVDLFSSVATEKREAYLRRYGLETEDLRIRHFEGDYTVHTELLKVDPFRYDNLLFVGSDWQRTGPEADARTILGALLVSELAAKREQAPATLVELLDPENVSLLGGGRTEVMVTPILVSHVLSQVALRRELRVVFEELFTAGGAEMVFQAPTYFGLEGEGDFARIQEAASARGETALGVRIRTEEAKGVPWGRVLLNPDRSLRWNFEAGVDVIALATYPEEARAE